MGNIEDSWLKLITDLQKSFTEELSLKSILFLIGVQELNMGIRNFSKEEKLDVLHIATCSLLSKYGFYMFDKIDEEGWPHWKEVKPVDSVSEKDQEVLLKKAILNYFNKAE